MCMSAFKLVFTMCKIEVNVHGTKFLQIHCYYNCSFVLQLKHNNTLKDLYAVNIYTVHFVTALNNPLIENSFYIFRLKNQQQKNATANQYRFRI